MSNYVKYNGNNTDKDGIPIYGMDKELNEKKMAKYDRDAENDVRNWIEAITGERFKSKNFYGMLIIKSIDVKNFKRITQGWNPFVQTHQQD